MFLPVDRTPLGYSFVSQRYARYVPKKSWRHDEINVWVLKLTSFLVNIVFFYFYSYCNQVLRKDVDECVSSLLKELVRFQDRLYQKDPMKARMKRRLVMGLREVLKHLKLRKVKCVIISPNCERIQSKGSVNLAQITFQFMLQLVCCCWLMACCFNVGGLDEALHTIIDTCRDQGVPFVFALSRKALGRCVNKAVPVSLVGIFNYDGAQVSSTRSLWL